MEFNDRIVIDISRSKHPVLRRFLGLMTAVYNYLSWSWRFYSFGWKSRLGRCDMLTNPRAISIAGRVQIRKGARLEAIGDWDGKFPKITIGEGSAIQFHFHCGAAQSVTIGKDVLIAGRVYISDHDHVFDDPEKPAISCSKLSCKPVVVEDGVFLGQGCAILKGVTIGQRAIVGANAVVTKNVPPFTVVAGVPARVIRTIGKPEVKQK